MGHLPNWSAPCCLGEQKPAGQAAGAGNNKKEQINNEQSNQ
jgi:hypothetical protein